ETKLKPLSKS
ncbi:hypothetical protein TIFTF001_035611, partial [Ficus carica]